MENFTFEDNKLILKVGESSRLVRAILFLTAFMFFLLPISGLALGLSNGGGITFGSVIVTAIFFLLGFYLLRISLWNTFGREIIEFNQDKITYTADYGWFRDKVKEISIENLNCSLKPDESKTKGVLIFEANEIQIESVVQLPISVLEKVIDTAKLHVLIRLAHAD